MTKIYTVALREKGKSIPFVYIGSDLRVHDTTRHSAQLTHRNAALAMRLLIEGAEKVGRPIECRIVRVET